MVLRVASQCIARRRTQTSVHVTRAVAKDLFYTDVKLFQKQSESDSVLDDAACMIGCTRSSLNGVCGGWASA